LKRSGRQARPRFAPDSGAGRLPGNAVFVAAVPGLAFENDYTMLVETALRNTNFKKSLCAEIDKVA
jgi:hypothetical protein